MKFERLRQMDPDYIYIGLLSVIVLIGGIPAFRAYAKKMIEKRDRGSVQHYPQFQQVAPRPPYIIGTEPPPIQPSPETPKQPWWEDRTIIIAILTFLTLLVNTWAGRRTSEKVVDNSEKVDKQSQVVEDSNKKIEKLEAELKVLKGPILMATKRGGKDNGPD